MEQNWHHSKVDAQHQTIAIAAAAVKPGRAPNTIPTIAARTTKIKAYGSLNRTTKPQEIS